MAILVTLDSLRTYTRGLDERLRDIRKYPDSWIDASIDEGYELVASKGQSFLNEEVLDLTQYIIDGTAKFEVEMDHDVTGWKAAFYEQDANYIYDFPLRTRFVVGSPVGIQIKADNKVEVNLDDTLISATKHLITFQYYYFPRTLTGDQYFSTDVYGLVRSAVASSVYNTLHDYEKRDNFDNQLAKGIRSIVNTWDYDASNVRNSSWNV